jgi:hypothetical protein
VNRLRLGLVVTGLLLAVLSVAFDNRQLGWAAIVLLTGSLILRLWLRKRVNRSAGGDQPL